MKVSADHPLVVTYHDYERPSPKSLRTLQSVAGEVDYEAEQAIESACHQFIEAYTPGRK
jgi:hypothetical protein